MVYEIYLDAVFLTNLIMDYILLRLVANILKCRVCRRRSLVGALVGALGACVILVLTGGGGYPTAILLHGVLGIWMVKIGCQVHTGSMLLQATAALYMAAFLIGGFWDVASAGGGMALKTFLLLAAASYGLALSLGRLWALYKVRTENLYEVHLSYQGKVHKMTGFYDTGNHLTDLGSVRPVSIMSWKILKEMVDEDTLSELKAYQESHEEQNRGDWRNLKPHFLTFQSVGNPDGMALAVSFDVMCILSAQDAIVIDRPVFALAGEELSAQKDYQVILNAALLEK